MRGQAFAPVPHRVAQFGREAELVVEANFGDAVDLPQGFGELEVRRVVHTALQGGDDLRARQSGAARPAHGEDEGPAEAGVVGGIELGEAGEISRRAVRQTGAALLVGGLGSKRAGDDGLARQFRVGANQGEPFLAAGLAHGLRQRVLERGQGGERSGRPGARGDPGRVFVHAVQQGGEGVLRSGVQCGDLQQDQLQTKAVAASKGCVVVQCRAMSMRRATQTRSCRAM
ncbi:hypothetical protein GALL_472380 [mine drainage metagenome]|uniref:Uncharacterized protein n=1 Tax=mine drainage metagenome TaxID=410659 RepID=A0A1J5PHR7_9ZZZZ